MAESAVRFVRAPLGTSLRIQGRFLFPTPMVRTPQSGSPMRFPLFFLAGAMAGDDVVTNKRRKSSVTELRCVRARLPFIAYVRFIFVFLRGCHA